MLQVEGIQTMRKTLGKLWWVAALAGLAVGPAACTSTPHYDVILRGGTLYDGTGRDPVSADIAFQGDKIAAIGDLAQARGTREID